MTRGNNEPIAEYHQLAPGAEEAPNERHSSDKKILVEFPFFDGISRQTIRGSDNADSDGNTCSGSDSTHLPFFQAPQKLCLNLRRPLGDLVEKKGPAVSLLKAAQMPL